MWRRGRAPSPHAQRNDVGSGGQSGGHPGGVAGGNDHVVIFTGPKTTEHGSCLLRCDQRQVSQESEDVFGWLQSRRDEGDFDIFVVEVPSQRGCQAHGSLIHHGLQASLSKDVNSCCTTGPFISGTEHRTALCRASSSVPSTLYGLSVRRLISFDRWLPSHGTSRFRSCFGLMFGPSCPS